MKLTLSDSGRNSALAEYCTIRVRKKNLKFISGSTICTLFSCTDLTSVLYSAKRMFKHEKVDQTDFNHQNNLICVNTV